MPVEQQHLVLLLVERFLLDVALVVGPQADGDVGTDRLSGANGVDSPIPGGGLHVAKYHGLGGVALLRPRGHCICRRMLGYEGLTHSVYRI